MAGGTITRISSGNSTTEVENNFEGFYNNLTMTAGEQNRFVAKTTNYGTPLEPKAGKYFIKGWWTDENNQEIKETTIGEKVRFHLRTQDIPDGDKIIFYVYEWDGLKIFSDKLDLVKSGTSQISNEIEIKSNTGYIEWITGEGIFSFFNENLEGVEIELFVECSYKEEQLDLPLAESNYLILYEKEVLITVIIELPHSHYSLTNAAKNIDSNELFSALGLAGHSAMAIGQKYFDYGPDNVPGNYSEKEYDVDFNDDGDKDDVVTLSSPSFKNSPGRPWWGEMVADDLGIKAADVTLKQVFDYIQLDWRLTGIYGEVYKVEFYVKKSEADKMLKWWEERYKHLKIYSVFPWQGEQCTTTVKTAIQQAFGFNFVGKNYIADETQRPSGLLSELKRFVSTSKQHYDEFSIETIIKKESANYVP